MPPASFKVLPFFCDRCGAPLSTGHVCPACRRILCHRHYFGTRLGYRRRKDGLCAECVREGVESKK
ncbi:MAG: hypothetical protein ACP5R5_12205 [Armatimonadota bacterium]